MDYEKKYKDSLLAMKRMVEAGIIEECYVKDIFPELAETDDERIRKELICFLESEVPQCDARDKYIAWLENLKDRVLPQSKSDWDEEDEDKFNQICSCIEAAPSDVCYYSSETLENWLKSLRPHSQWKPSDEQMKALLNMRFAVERFGPSASLAALDELYEQLKKL